MCNPSVERTAAEVTNDEDGGADAMVKQGPAGLNLPFCRPPSKVTCSGRLSANGPPCAMLLQACACCRPAEHVSLSTCFESAAL